MPSQADELVQPSNHIMSVGHVGIRTEVSNIIPKVRPRKKRGYANVKYKQNVATDSN